MFVGVTAAFRLLYVSVTLGHARRKILHLNVTQHPTAGWLSRQITEAFPWDTRHATCCEIAIRLTGDAFRSGLGSWGSQRSLQRHDRPGRMPMSSASSVRFAASVLDHVVVINERHLRRVLISYLDYYHCSRTHLSLDKDCPDARPIQQPNSGMVIAIAQVGGLHHRYERLAA